MILALIFIALAAICKALVDTIAFHSGGRFKGNDFFDINKQGKMLPLTKYPLDAFHLSNSLMILFFILAAISHVSPPLESLSRYVGRLGEVGIIFILVFNLFFNHIFK